jgi:hypothetical protein
VRQYGYKKLLDAVLLFKHYGEYWSQEGLLGSFPVKLENPLDFANGRGYNIFAEYEIKAMKAGPVSFLWQFL